VAATGGSLRDELAGFGYAYIFVGAPVVEEEAVGFLQHSFDEYNVANLAHFFPFELWREKGLFGAIEKLAGIFAVEDGDAGAVTTLSSAPL
jgi:hypothetical protein